MARDQPKSPGYTVYNFQCGEVNAGKTLQAPRHLPRLTTPSHPQVKMASWSREKPGNWYSTFRRGKKVSCWKLR